MTIDIPPRAALWDMDGTLLDSAEYHWLAWRDSMLDLGYPLTYEEFAATFGQRNDTILRSWISKEITDIEIARISDVKEARYRTLVREHGIDLLPGVRGWLERLQAAGWRQAVASSAPRANVEALVEILDIGVFFGALVAAEDVQRGKPDPQVFLTAAERLGVSPARCVVLEDAPAGIEAAHRAGMRAIGIRSSHPGLQADITVQTLDELPEDTFDRLISDERSSPNNL
jgi:beta-phosphoglucomutase family hydrolase